MLKIKDNVDLKELEKFGYKIVICDYGNHLENIGMFWRKKIIRNDRLVDIIKIYGYEHIDFDEMDYIQDLIKADLVEKVVEDE